MEVVSKQKVKVEMNGTNSEQQKLTLSGTVLSIWQDVDWQKVNADVRRLRQRIFVASKQGDLKKVGSLQKLMLRSKSNWLKSIRQVTQINKGRRTPGVDREVITTPEERVELFYWLGTFPLNKWNPPPVKRVEIPKDNGKTRPLGIPTIRDRVIQAIVKNALEPYWEAKFEGTSYGFRPGRSTHDAVESIWQAENRGKRPWIVDADIKGAFDNIAHEPLMEAIGLFPGRFLIRKWLKAGVMKNLVLTPSETGTPQGGVISPLLANIALHGMEETLGVKYKFKRDKNGQVYQNVISPVKVVRYCDDFVILTETEAQAIEARDRIAQWLKTKGLELSAEKTHITTLENGFDFLGFTIIRRKNALSKSGYATHVFPSKKSVTKFKKKIKEIATRGQAYKTKTIIVELNPLITGWAYYYRMGVSSEIFENLDYYIWTVMWKWARRRHPNKGKKWVKTRYYVVHKGRSWTLKSDAGSTLRRLQEVKIVRHVKVRGTDSPDDPELEAYWILRKRRNNSMLGVKAAVYEKQKGVCPQCGDWLDGGEEVHIHHKDRNRNNWKMSNLEMLHETCHQQRHSLGLLERGCDESCTSRSEGGLSP